MMTKLLSWYGQMRQIRHSHLARRFLGAILLISTLGAFLATFTELALDYRYELKQVRQAFDDIQNTAASTAAYSLWIVNPDTLQRQMADLLRLPNVHYVEVVESDGTRYQRGHPVLPERDRVQRVFKLEYRHPISGKELLMGTMSIEASTSEIKSHLMNRFFVVFFTQGLKTFFVSFFILAFFQWLITRHLHEIIRQARSINYLNLRKPLTLDRAQEDDELNELLGAFNQMRRNLLCDIEILEKNEEMLMAENISIQQTLHMLPEIVLRTDSRSQVVWINHLGEQTIRHDKRPLQGKLLGEVLPAAEGFVNASADRVFVDAQNNRTVLRRRIMFRHANGGIMAADASCVLLHDDEKLSQGVIMVLSELEQVESGSALKG